MPNGLSYLVSVGNDKVFDKNFRVLSTWYQQVFPVFVYFDLLEVFLRQTRFAGFGFRMKTNASLDHKPSMCFLVLLSLFFHHMLQLRSLRHLPLDCLICNKPSIKKQSNDEKRMPEHHEHYIDTTYIEHETQNTNMKKQLPKSRFLFQVQWKLSSNCPI